MKGVGIPGRVTTSAKGWRCEAVSCVQETPVASIDKVQRDEGAGNEEGGVEGQPTESGPGKL